MGNCINVEDNQVKKILKESKQEMALISINQYLSLLRPTTFSLPCEKIDLIDDAINATISKIHSTAQAQTQRSIYMSILYSPIKGQQKSIWKEKITADPFEVVPPSATNSFKIVVFTDTFRKFPSYLSEKEREHAAVLMYGEEIKLVEKLFGKFGELDRLIFDFVKINKKYIAELAQFIGPNTKVEICKHVIR